MVTILIIALLLILVGALPIWDHSRAWGPDPSGIVGVILIIILVIWLLGRL